MTDTIPLEADYIVAGGGLSGCALASRIKEFDPSLSVLVIEAGNLPADKHDVVSPMGGFALAGTELDWQYRTAPAPTLDGRTFTLTAGKTLGGGSVLNYGGWSRGQVNDYNDWSRKVRDERWSYNGLLPYMKKSEHFISQTDKAQHGFDGPFKISSVSESDPMRRYPLRDVIEAGWAEIGLRRIEKPCSGELDGLSEFYENWDKGRRQPSQLAYDMTGIGVLSGHFTSKILISPGSGENGSVAEGVKLLDGRVIRARKEIVISAGAFQTPLVLLRSGLGSGIPSIGHNYAEHFAVYQLWKLKGPERGLALGSSKLTDPAMFKGLPMDWVANEAPPREEIEKALDIDGVSGSERESLLRPGRTFVETMILYTSLVPGVPADGSYLSTSIMLTVPSSRGRVSLPDIETDQPVIQPNYCATAFDQLCISHGVKRLAQLMLDTQTMQPYIECEIPPPGMPPIDTSSSHTEILDRVRKTGMPHFHPAGTCAMGDVVDTSLKVKGVKGLRICDASILPLPIGGHPMATLYAVAEQAAEIIIRDI